MARQKINASHFSKDVQEFLYLLNRYQLKYLIVGGEAVIYYGYARLTGDVDFFYERSQENVNRLFNALKEFWSGDVPGIERPEELYEEGAIIQFGRPPNRIDLINEIENVSFGDAWAGKETVEMSGERETIPIYYINLEHLIRNKESVKRPKDLEDLKYLYEVQKKTKRE